MKILQRYIFKELLLPCMLCFVILSFIFTAGYLVKIADVIIGRGTPLTQTLYAILLAMPTMISYTAPMSLLTGVLIVFGSFSQHNEFRAMKASGVHPLRFMMPPILIGIALSLFMVFFNDQVAPEAKFELRKVMKKMIMQHPMALIKPGRFVNIGKNIIFLAKTVEGKQMRDIVAHEGVDSKDPVRTIVAERGEIVINDKSGKLEVVLFDGSVSESEDDGVSSVQFSTYKFPTFGATDISRMEKKRKDLTLAEILVKLPEDSGDKKKDLWTIFHMRIAFSFGSLIFVLIGIPIATIVRRGDVIISFGISMFAASFYYILFATAQAVASRGIFPPFVCFWTPNILLGLLGVYLIRRAISS